MATFISHRRVEFSHTDMAGIVHFSNFYKWMEEIEHDFFRSNNITFVERDTEGIYYGWPRVSAKCSFHAPARYDDLIEGRLQLERIGVKSLSYFIEFWNGDVLLANGRLKVAFCAFSPDGTLKSLPIPEEMRRTLETHVITESK